MDPALDIVPSTVASRVKPVAAFLLRTVLFAALAYAVFGWLFVPVTIRSEDMLPTYAPGGVTFCFRPGVWIGAPDRGDVVFVRLPGHRRLLLLRVVGVAGDSVGFASGRLIVNGRFMAEPYVANAGTWTLAPAVVREACVFVVGDNRSTPMGSTPLGQVEVGMIAGTAVW